MPGDSGDKTEKASPKKREDERKKGNIFMSKDVTTVVSVVVSFYAVSYFFSSFAEQVQRNYMRQMERALVLDVLDVSDVMAICREFFVLIATTAVPAMLIIAIATTLTVLLQTRFLVSGESIKFKFERIDPIKGFKRLFSLRSLVELAKSILKIAVLTWLLYGNVRRTVGVLPGIMDWDINQAAGFAGSEILSLVIATGIAFGGVSLLDYLYQWYEYEKNIKMSKQEVKDEYKQMEGNPEVKGARRQRQRELAQSRMMQQVQQADVVVRNPTHFAVALKYDMKNDPAPVILAKGADRIAMKIVEEAEKHDILTVENKPLARGLYDLGQVDHMIPAELFQPVAELLAWLYSSKKKEKIANENI